VAQPATTHADQRTREYQANTIFCRRIIGLCAISPDNRVRSRRNAGTLKAPTHEAEGDAEQMNIAAKIRARRARARNRRAVSRAIDAAATPALRHELMVIAQAQSTTLR
jgi:hypothetical protein